MRTRSWTRGLSRLIPKLPDGGTRAETRLRLRADNGARMKSVTLNGKPWAGFDPAGEYVIIPAGTRGIVDIVARY